MMPCANLMASLGPILNTICPKFLKSLFRLCYLFVVKNTKNKIPRTIYGLMTLSLYIYMIFGLFGLAKTHRINFYLIRFEVE
jgi:hypothetical protein